MRLAKFYTLRNKLIVSFLAVALVPLILLTIINKYTTEKTLTDNANQALFTIASQTALSLDTFITTNLNDVRVAAILPGLSQYLSLPPEARIGSPQQKVAGDTLRSLSRRDTVNIFSYALLDLKGRNVLDTYTPNIGKDEFNYDYFQQALKTNLPYVSNLRLSPTVARLVNIYFSNPVRNSTGIVVGVLRLSYNATVVQQLITRQTGLAGSKSFAILLDEHYIRLAHGTAPELNFKSLIPLSADLVKQLQAEGRLPYLSISELSTNLPELKQGVDNAANKPYFTIRLTETDNQLNAVAIAPLQYQSWFVLFVQPQSVFLAPIEAQTRTALILAILIAGLVIIMAIIMGRTLAEPIIILTKTLSLFTAGNLNVRVAIGSKDEIGNLAQTFNIMMEKIKNYTESLEVKNAALLQAEVERERFTNELSQLNLELEQALDAEFKLTDAYGRFVPHQFLHFLGSESIVDVKLGDFVQEEMSVLFADIRDFTTLSEMMTPEENFKFINAYLSRMEPCITANNGFIDKYIGDAIMALFSSNADNAVQAAIAMLKTLTEYNQHRASVGYVAIQIGVGINTGSLMLGTVGGENRMDSTVISDAVNLASRIEGLTKVYGVALLITNHTFLRLQNPSLYDIRIIDRVKVKGKSQDVTIYEVFDADPAPVREGKLATMQTFINAFSLYQKQNFREAIQLFQCCLDQNPRDKVALFYVERCQQNLSGFTN